MSTKKEAGQGKRRKLCVCEGKGSENSSDASRCMLGLNNLRLAFISSDSKMKDSHQTR